MNSKADDSNPVFNFNEFNQQEFESYLETAYKNYSSPPPPNLVSDAKEAAKKINGKSNLPPVSN